VTVAHGATRPAGGAAEPRSFRHSTPAYRSFCGEGSLSALGPELDRLGCRRAVVLTGEWLLGYPSVVERLTAVLGDRLVGTFTDVAEHSPIPAVEEAAQELSGLNADAIIALGGGSSIVTARAAAIFLAETGSARELCTQRSADGRLVSPKLLAPKLPIWIVPSTPTTAYAKAGAAVRDPASGDRLALYDPKTRAQGVIFDPEVALTAPAQLARAAALNAFAMTVEGIQGAADPLADALLVHGLRTLAQWLPRLDEAPQDAGVRLELMVGALLSGQGSDYVGGGLAQALAHAAGPRSAVPNGVVEVILLPHTMRFTASATPGRLGLVADALGRPVGAGAEADDAAIAAVDDFLKNMGVARRLRDTGLSQDQLDDIAEHTLEDWSLTRIPRQADRADLLGVLEAAW
jgi:alcohol dehydrogenase class IV